LAQVRKKVLEEVDLNMAKISHNIAKTISGMKNANWSHLNVTI
jgi:hypothetical protein